MGTVSILVMMYLSYTPPTNGLSTSAKMEARCLQSRCRPLPIRANSRSLWLATGWSEENNMAFESCDDLTFTKKEVVQMDIQADEEEQQLAEEQASSPWLPLPFTSPFFQEEEEEEQIYEEEDEIDEPPSTSFFHRFSFSSSPTVEEEVEEEIEEIEEVVEEQPSLLRSLSISIFSFGADEEDEPEDEVRGVPKRMRKNKCGVEVEETLSQKMIREGLERGKKIRDESIAKGKKMADDGLAKGKKMAGKGMAKGKKMAGEGAVKGKKMAGEGVVKGKKMAGEGVVKGKILAGKGVAKGIKMAGEGVVKGKKMCKQVGNSLWSKLSNYLYAGRSQCWREKPPFCRKGDVDLLSGCGVTLDPFNKAFEDLLDFYDPFFPTRECEGGLIDRFLNAFIETPVGQMLYGMIMFPDPFQGENDRYMELRDTVWGWSANFFEKKVNPAITEKLKLLAAKMNNHQREMYYDKLKRMWFGNEKGSRGLKRRIGFRHVFVGEKRKNVVGEEVLKGMFNWHQFKRLLCKKYNPKNPDGTYYFDYVLKSREGDQPKDEPVRYCNVGLKWNGLEKFVYISKQDESVGGTSNILFGGKPEYDFAVFTLCFHKHVMYTFSHERFNGKCSTHLGNANIVIVGSHNKKAYKITGNSQIVTTYFK